MFETSGSEDEELKTIQIGSSKRVSYLSLRYDAVNHTYNGIRFLDDEEEFIIDEEFYEAGVWT